MAQEHGGRVVRRHVVDPAARLRQGCLRDAAAPLPRRNAEPRG